MDQMTRRAFGAAGFALLLATSATFAQQQSPTVRVRGTVEGADGPMLTVKSRDGQTTYQGENGGQRRGPRYRQGLAIGYQAEFVHRRHRHAAGRRQPEGR